MTSYLTPSQIRTLAATLPGMAAVVAMDDPTLSGWASLATIDVNTSVRYQGRKYRHLQDNEFPRVAYGDFVFNAYLIPHLQTAFNPQEIWAWDPVTKSAVVPELVNIAFVYQVAWLSDPSNAKVSRRVRDIISGLQQQQIGTASETFTAPAELAAYGGLTGLDIRAFRILNTYRLRTGSMQ